MKLEDINDILIPRLRSCNVIKVTLTGGEPFIHPNIIEIVRSFRAADINVSICSNGTLINSDQIDTLARLGDIQINVSLDGFSKESHGRFRGDMDSFDITCNNIRKLSKQHLLRGILVTPNNLSSPEEYIELHRFAAEVGAKYVLMNPLSCFGRGVKSKQKLGSPHETMEIIRELTSSFQESLELIRIRFPNKTLPLSSCEAERIIYVFTSGELTVCPYLVFSAKTPQSLHRPEEFIVGNIFKDYDISSKLDMFKFYDKYPFGKNLRCKKCSLTISCGKGCPAAVINQGYRIGEVDHEMCPYSDKQ